MQVETSTQLPLLATPMMASAKEHSFSPYTNNGG